MKRIYLLISAVAVSVVGVMGIGSSAASADVLCDTFNSVSCPAGHKYPVGTELHARTVPGKSVTLYEPYKTFKELDCGGSEMVFRVDNAGSVMTNVETTLTSLSLVNCNITPTIESPGTATFSMWESGSWAGKAQLSNQKITYKSKTFGIKCTVTSIGGGKIIGPPFVEGESSTLTFESALAKTNYCGNMYFSGNYYFSNPKGVYVNEY